MNPDAASHDVEHGGRPPYRPPVGLPNRAADAGWRGTAASVALHALIILLLIVPFFASETLRDAVTGAGGAGPAGGGGGGHGGTGGQFIKERLQYVEVAPQPKAATVPAVTPPVVKPPEVKPPVTPPPTPAPTPAATIAPPAPAAPPAASVTPGTGGGSGNDGSQGNGPGTGGGVGSGEGTGRGTATGPGTGGGPGQIYPPNPTVVFIPPQPVPGKVRGTQVVAHFDVDEKGNVLSVEFTETRDGGYNRKLRDMLRDIRFKPAVRADGTPVRAVAELVYTL